MQHLDSSGGAVQERWAIIHIFKSSRHALKAGRLGLAATALLLSWAVGAVLDQAWLGTGAGLTAEQLAAAPLIATLPQTTSTSTESSATAAGEDAKTSEPRYGLFSALCQHYEHCISQALKAGRKLQFSGHMGQVHQDLHRIGGDRLRPTVGKGYGVASFIVAIGSGTLWLVMKHWFFTVMLFGGLLWIWAAFGGAICRMASVYFANNETPSMAAALKFSSRKRWELMLAPLLPLGFGALCGSALWITAWVCSWTWWGSFLTGVTRLAGAGAFAFAIMAGIGVAAAVCTLVIGFHLMWPTIAAEGSDFADAVGRSIMYTIQAIERTFIYAVVVVVYGSFAWFVVRFFTFLALWATHGIAGRAFPGIESMWAAPSFDTLFAAPSGADSLEGWVSGGVLPFMIKLWVNGFALIVLGYLASYYFTASTIVYHLLRRAVDETDLDDIYTEDQQDTPPAPPPATPAMPANPE
jgi:hypothetical protein